MVHSITWLMNDMTIPLSKITEEILPAMVYEQVDERADVEVDRREWTFADTVLDAVEQDQFRCLVMDAKNVYLSKFGTMKSMFERCIEGRTSTNVQEVHAFFKRFRSAPTYAA